MGTTPVENIPATGQLGGYMMKSVMSSTQYLKVLFVFVQFKDDQLVLDSSIGWPLNQAPTAMMGTNIVDPSITTNSTNYNLTHYYKVMSMNHFNIIGTCYNIITPYTRDEYIAMKYKRGQINRQILELLDEEIDFVNYDNWQKNGYFNQNWGGDGYVDMIVMIYRNISLDKPNPNQYAKDLDFDDGTNLFTGEASLGNGGILYVDEGDKHIDLGHYFSSYHISGITLACGNKGIAYVRNIVVHELGHHLLGGNEYHATAGSWGMMAQWGSRSQMINAFERHRLGWITALQFNYTPNGNISLGDFITTGDALRIKIPNSNPERFYYLENHQRISELDNIDNTMGGQGIYLFYNALASGIMSRLFNAQGLFQWSKFESILHHPGVYVPVFRKVVEDNVNGYFDTDLIHSIDTPPAVSMMEAYRDTVSNQSILSPIFWGDGKDMMSPGYMDVMSPYSNPPLENVAIQLVNENNGISVKQFYGIPSVVNCAPSRPQNFGVRVIGLYPNLIWKSNTEPDVIGKTGKRGKYKIYRASSTNGTIPTNYSYIATVDYPTTSYTDYNWFTPGTGSAKVFYRISAVDTTNLESAKTEFDSVRYNPALLKEYKEIITDYKLYENYPNPFNPSTTINYEIPINGQVELKVYDVLGKEVVTLVQEYQNAGKYSVVFDSTLLGANLSSGLYLYQLKTGTTRITKKMVLLK